MAGNPSREVVCMKKILALLLTLCLVLGIASAALAAGAPKITKQPVSATTDKNGKVTFSLKVKNAKGITWKFINPENGEEILASQISKLFKGLKVSGQNRTTLVLKNVPDEMHNWSLYCHLTGNGYKVDSDIVQLKVYGLPDEPTPAPEPEITPEPEPEITPEPVPEVTPEPVQEITPEPQPDSVPSPETNPESSPEATPVPSEEPVDPFRTAEDAQINEQLSRIITVSAEGLILCPLDARGKPIEDQQADTLTFEGSGDISVRSENPVKYWVINGIHVEPEGDVKGFVLKNITQDLTISAKVEMASSAADVDESVQCQVTCTGCSFTYLAGDLRSAVSGSVPSGAVITVMADSVDAAAKGYSINGGPAEQEGKLSFRLTVTGDTAITIAP